MSNKFVGAKNFGASSVQKQSGLPSPICFHTSSERHLADGERFLRGQLFSDEKAGNKKSWLDERWKGESGISPFQITLDSKSNRYFDENGYLVIKDNKIAKAGVFEYLGREKRNIRQPDRN